MTIGRRLQRGATLLGLLLSAGAVYGQQGTRPAQRPATRVVYEDVEVDPAPEMPDEAPGIFEAPRAGSPRRAGVPMDRFNYPPAERRMTSAPTTRGNPRYERRASAETPVREAPPRAASPMRSEAQSRGEPRVMPSQPAREMRSIAPRVAPRSTAPESYYNEPPRNGGAQPYPRTASRYPSRRVATQMEEVPGPTEAGPPPTSVMPGAGRGSSAPTVAPNGSGRVVREGAPYPQGGAYHDGEMPYGYEGDGCCDDGCCQSGCNISIGFCDLNLFDDLTLFGGVEGFKSALDGGLNGSFGTHIGFNAGIPLIEYYGLGLQLGARSVQSNFEQGEFLSDRHQHFVTGGVFHRPMCGDGWQWGVVYDYLNDDFYEDIELSQIRGEFGLVFRGCHNVGLLFMSGRDDATLAQQRTFFGNEIRSVESHDVVAAFYRHYLCEGGEWRVWGGATSENGGVFGADFRLPINDRWALQSDVTYVAPDDGARGMIDEIWNVSVSLVWHPGYRARCQNGRPYRPLFDVADNGSFLTRGY